ncbi:MAG: choline dehydrogenase [Rubrivivax sp.]|nr:choline dehydrogenase [Rubrivivax sp.]HOZ92463.1 choline dehydrogenase [Ottowia sp.]HQO51862.1 choline dehydrogenase [Ottowia sp.]
MNTPVCDYLIVGGGTAGCVLANRLSADPSCRVILLEAGGPDDDKWIHIPAGIRYLLREKKHNWFYMTEPSPLTNGRSVYWPRGKVLGGSSSINGMVYIRGQRTDFDRWAASGATGWDWDSLFPYFLKIENQTRGADAYHAVGGPLTVSDRTNRSEVWTRFIAAAEQLGIPRNPDFNGADQEGVGYYQATVGNGRRCSAAVGYLRPVKGRANLSVITGAMVHHISFEQRRATGVRYEKDGHWHELHAAREVLVCGGSINSPQLLMLSGIGPAAHLQEMGITPRVDAPQLGKNLQDHLQLRLTYRLNRPISFNDQFHSLAGKVGMGLEYLLRRSGAIAYPTAQVGLFTRSLPELASPDIQYHFSNYTTDEKTGMPDRFPGMTFSVCHLRPESRGEILLRSPDPGQHPRILPNYLATPEDCRVAVEEVRLTRRLAATQPLADIVAEELAPGPDVQSDEACLDFARSNGTSIYHPVGTCRMGSDAEAVVDPALCVRGVSHLRVVDASVMPTLISGNTYAATLAIAERAADLILNTRP